MESLSITCILYLQNFFVIFSGVCSFEKFNIIYTARRAGSDGSVSASGSAGPGIDPRQGSKFLFENFQPWD